MKSPDCAFLLCEHNITVMINALEAYSPTANEEAEHEALIGQLKLLAGYFESIGDEPF